MSRERLVPVSSVPSLAYSSRFNVLTEVDDNVT